MKLVIQIPCYNEEMTLPVTLNELPRHIPGFDAVELLLIDDGSTDNSVEVAKEHHVDHIISFTNNKGLAEAFTAGLNECVNLGADVIVNFDADNQYSARDIPKLLKPILEGKAEIVIGARPISDISHFSAVKKLLQKLGSFVVRKVSKTDIPDSPSGFRAITRNAAMKLNVFSRYTYTLETIIQAGRKNMAISWVPIDINEDLRPSRLVKSIFQYVKVSILTMLRIFVVYEPFKFFVSIGLVLFVSGFVLGIRFLYFFFTDGGEGHVQSLILAGALLGMGFQTMLIAFIADLHSAERKMMEDIQYRIRKLEAGNEKNISNPSYIKIV